ncbi:Uncharacterised protein [uncultured archaeon]|nr:Uncharacterised protein [uncultured archaeon]
MQERNECATIRVALNYAIGRASRWVDDAVFRDFRVTSGPCAQNIRTEITDQLFVFEKMHSEDSGQPVYFEPIRIRFENIEHQGRRNRSGKIPLRITDNNVEFHVSNEPLSDELAERIRDAARGAERFIGIAGGGTMPLRLASVIQEVSDLKTFRLVDKDQWALANFATVAAARDSCPALPVYYLRESDVRVSARYCEEVHLDYRRIKKKDLDGKRELLEVRKWPCAKDTEFSLRKCNVSDEAKRTDLIPAKTFIYLSSINNIPGYYNPWYMGRRESQRLLDDIAKNKGFAENSAVLMYQSDRGWNMPFSSLLLLKRGGTLNSAYGAKADGRTEDSTVARRSDGVYARA